MPKKYRNKKANCLNCSYSFLKSENFCPQCGQENHDLKIHFSHIVEEFLEGLFHFDSKLWLSIKTLFFYPGKITKDFLAGKRVSFVPPVRLYIFFSFLFFFFLNLATEVSEKEKEEKIVDMLKKSAGKDSVNIVVDSLEIDLDNDTTKLTAEEKNARLKLQKLIQLNREEVSHLNQKVYKYMSFALFFLLPVFALIMKIVYRKSGKFYYEHLIASIHYHVIVFIALLLYLVVYKLHLPKICYLFLTLGIFIYFVHSLKVVFGRSWINSALKGVIIFVSYGMILLLTSTFCAIAAAYFFFK